MEIRTIATIKFSWIFILTFLLTIGIIVGISIVSESGLFLLLIFLLLPVIMILSLKAASRTNHITINTENFLIDEKTIEFVGLEGYYLNKQGLLMSSLDLKLNNGDLVSITCSKFGEQGKKFTQLAENLVKAIGEQNPAFRVMEYQEVHVKQMKYLRPLIIGGIIIVLVVDVLAILMTVTGQGSFPWELLLPNVIFLTLLPYLKKSRDTYFPKSVQGDGLS